MKISISKYLKATVVAILIIMLIVLGFSLLFQYNILNGDQSTFSTFGFIVSLVVYFIIGFFVSNVVHKRGLVVGMIGGLLTVMLVMLFRFLGLDASISSSNMIRSLIQILSAALGGFIGVNIFPLFKQK